jgi:hypothetical protein
VSIPGAVFGLAVLLGPAWLIARRERGWAAIATLQLAGQQVVHVLLGLAAGGAAHATVPEDLSMYGHITAAALIAAWLRCGERRLWAAARRAGESVAAWLRWVLALHRPSPPPRSLVLTPTVGLPGGRPGTPLRHVLVRRGPPLPA